MGRVTGGLALLTLVVGVGAALQQPESKPIGKQMEITGTVVDMACYFNKGQHGPSHVPCATMCAKAGVPFAIRTSDGQIYIPAVHAENQNPKLQPFVEQVVTVTGTVYPAAGASTIEIAAIAKKP
jgi:hypothetical protein